MSAHDSNPTDASTDDERAPGAQHTEDAAAEPVRRRVRFVDVARGTLVMALIVGAAVGLYYTVRAADTGLDGAQSDLPESVLGLIPTAGSDVLRQSGVGLQLAEGYDAYLTINGVTVRDGDDGLIRDLGTGQVLYRPAEGQPVESLNQGQNCVVATVFSELDGESAAESVSWCFDAT